MSTSIFPDESIKDFLIAPKHGAFFVPEVYALPVCTRLSEHGFKTSWHAVTIGLLHVRALRVTLRGRGAQRQSHLTQALEILFGSSENLEAVPAMSRDRILPVVLPTNVVVTWVIRPIKDEDRETQEAKARAKTAYTEPLTRLAQVTHQTVVFHSTGESVEPPLHEENTIHIRTNASPPGETGSWYVKTAFGLPISLTKEAIGNGPTLGRGLVLKDQDNKNVLQILDNNWYILFPTLSYFNEDTSLKIFEQILALGLATMTDTKKAPVKPMRRQTWTTKARSWFDGFLGGVDSQIDKHQKDIEFCTRRLAELHRELEMWRSMRESMLTTTFTKKAKRRLSVDLNRLFAHDQIERIEFFEDALHVHTTDLVGEYDGQEYAFGTFVIRINRHGVISVWNESPRHPDGVPHPHIAKNGGPCYGNASTAIAKAAGEARYADAIFYVLTWLTHGYSPELAAVKIHEWPMVKKEERDAS